MRTPRRAACAENVPTPGPNRWRRYAVEPTRLDARARCQLQLARSTLAQRKRDHKKATTELRKAEQRVKSRKAVADKRERIAKQAKAKAEALAKGS